MNDKPDISRTTTDLEVNNSFEVREKILEHRIRALNEEIIRLKRKCGEDITMDELLHGFGKQSGMYRVVRSKNYG